MPMRPIRLPGDFLPLTEMLTETFQYPDHPEWGIREDEREDLLRMIGSLRRLWPIIRILKLFSSALRDLFCGFVWEEGGRIVGVVLCGRDGTTRTWGVNTVGVLPEYRGRGIARQLLARSLDEVRARGGDKAVLGVIDRNVPAYSLYASVGFERFSGVIDSEATPDKAPGVPPLPAGYRQEPVRRSKSWKVQYELDRRINPPELTRYQPVVVGRYRPPLLLRVVLPLLHLLQRRERRSVLVRRRDDGLVVAWARYEVPRRSGGVSSVRVSLDPEHRELADYLVAYHLDRAAARAPGRRVEFVIPSWMTAVVAAAQRCGFSRRVEYHMLGRPL